MTNERVFACVFVVLSAGAAGACGSSGSSNGANSADAAANGGGGEILVVAPDSGSPAPTANGPTLFAGGTDNPALDASTGDVTSPVDAMADAPSCDPTQIFCGGLCRDQSVEHCGSCDTPCAAPPNGRVSCLPSGGTYQCVASCNTGFSSCDTACFDLQNDAKNCGACGHTCGYGTCSGGACQPWRIATTSSDAVLPGGSQGNRVEMATDGVHLVWINPVEGIQEVSVADGTVTLLQGADGVAPANYGNIAMASGTVGWTRTKAGVGIEFWYAQDNAAYSARALTVDMSDTQRPWGLALTPDGREALFTGDPPNTTAGAVYDCTFTLMTGKCVMGTTNPTGASTYGNDMTFKNGRFYWTDSRLGNIITFAHPEITDHVFVAQQTTPVFIAADASYVYWVNRETSSQYSVHRTSQVEGAAVETVIPSTAGLPMAFATDGRYVYTVIEHTSISKFELDVTPVAGGTAPRELLPGRNIYSVLVGGSNLFWLEWDPKVSASGSTLVISGYPAP